jgi:hypothetical protein
MVDHVGNAADAIVPKADPKYLAWVADKMIEAGCAAVEKARPAEFGLGVVKVHGVGTNRHDPSGPSDAEVPLVFVREADGGAPIGLMVVYGMHPTVLHEDSTLVSGDFPHFTRRFLQQRIGESCPVLYHQGAAGDQSPRHVTRGNTFAEAQRLGELLGAQVAAVIPTLTFTRDLPIFVGRRLVELTPRAMPTLEFANRDLTAVRARFAELQRAGAPRANVRTAECNVFGAEETRELALAAIDGRLAAAVNECSPAEIQLVQMGPWNFVSWPGEFFADYALEIKRHSPNTFVITLANGELQAYIVTAEADANGLYEARNALFAHENGPRIVAETLALLNEPR